MSSVILGCGDVGRRVARCLIDEGERTRDIATFVNSTSSVDACSLIGLEAQRFDLDGLDSYMRADFQCDLNACVGANVYYTVAPQKTGVKDERSRALQKYFTSGNIKPKKLVLISTTGVYGDCDGEWVTEASPAKPQTERGQRRLDSETQWLAWGQQNSVAVVILRVPGIYARSRLPLERLNKRTPVVRALECGFTNRIHADDLANACVVAMSKGVAAEVYNITDGVPGKITEYLQAAAMSLNMEPLPEISMHEAQAALSSGMLSYLGESRKISNQKMLNELGVKLKYPDFRQGIQH